MVSHKENQNITKLKTLQNSSQWPDYWTQSLSYIGFYAFSQKYQNTLLYLHRYKGSDKMKITLLTVGKTDRDWVRQGLELYISRLKHYIPFSLVVIPELKNVSALSTEQIKVKEGELILKNIRPGDDLILMDERGKMQTSTEFAKFLQDKISYIGKDIIFVIGGAYGFSQAVYDRADSKISLSKMTFSHQMVRAIFAEQLYRAFTIMRGEPYHHE